MKFLDAWKDIQDSTPEGGHRVLLGQLPDFLRRKVSEQQDKNSSETPIVVLGELLE